MQPKETLFRVGDDSQSGIFIVVEGRLGVYLEEHDSDSLTLTNTLITGESVGDLDVLDGEPFIEMAHLHFGSCLPGRCSGEWLPNEPVLVHEYCSRCICCFCIRHTRKALCAVAGARRSVTCIAMEEGATLVNVSRDLFMSFIAAKPRTLQIYLHKACYCQPAPDSY